MFQPIFTSTVCTGSFVPVLINPLKSTHVDNPDHHVEGMKRDEMFKSAPFIIVK